MIRTFSELQEQHGVWSDRNFPTASFGDHDTGAFHGLVEEAGEFAGAYRSYCLAHGRHDEDAKELSLSDMKDAIGDIAIFHADYCRRRGFLIADILNDLGFGNDNIHGFQTEVIMSRETDFPICNLFTWLGQLAHARLKSRQGIRSGKAEHLQTERAALAEILICLALAHDADGKTFNLASIIAGTWAQVSQRDWIANPVTGRAAPSRLGTAGAEEKAATTPAEPDVYPTRSTLAYETR